METFNKTGQVFESQSFSGRSYSKFVATDCKFANCNFEGTRIADACFGAGNKKSLYLNCSFNNSKFSSKAPGVARFENCTFIDVDIEKFFCIDIEMVNCTFSGSIAQGNFSGIHAELDGKIVHNQYINNDFRELNLGDVGLVNIDLTKQKLPTGENFVAIYDLKKFLFETKQSAELLEDKGLSSSIVNALNIIEIEHEGGNNQVFLDKRSFPKRFEKALDAIFCFSKSKT